MTTIDQTPCKWLAHKYLLYSIGIYATLAGIAICTWLGIIIGLPAWIAIFSAFTLTIFVRTFYEQIIILNMPRFAISLQKNTLFALIYSIIMSFAFYYIKGPLGYWAIPITLVIAQIVIKPIRSYLWATKPTQQPLRQLYAQKQNIYMASLYGFYGLLAAIAVTGVQYLHWPFVLAFGLAVCIALITSILFEFHYLYEQHFDIKIIAYLFLLAIVLTLATTAIVILLVKSGLSGKVATIITCVIAKIIEQYLLSRWMCAQKTCALCNKV